MFRKSLLASLVVLASASVAYAADPAPAAAPVSYKGEAPAPMPVAVNYFPVVPYAGFGVGVRNNYSSLARAYKGVDGRLFLGYGGLVNQAFYLAGEAFVLGSGQVSNYDGGTRNAKSTWGYGASLIPGFTMTDRLLGFARVGVIDNHFTQGGSKLGGQLGLGLQTGLNQNWDIRGEYDYAFYRNTSAGTPRADTFNVDFIYKFL